MHIKETGESFSAKFATTSVEGEGLKIGAGLYTISLEASAVFKGKPPTREQIIVDFVGSESISIGFGLMSAGINGTESGRWTITTGNLNISVGCPLSFGVEKSSTRVRK